jgi:TonB family protein
MLSLSLHGALVAVVLFLTYALQTQIKETPKIFELVAGEGDNYMATEAPALGVPGVKLNVPAAIPVPINATPAPEPEPVIERAPEKPAVKTPPKTAEAKPVETKTPNYTKDVMRIAKKRESRLVEADRKKREAEAKRISKAEFDKLNKGKTASKQPVGTGAKVARIDAEGIAKGVVGGSVNNKTGGAGGKALSRAEQSALESYIALLIQRLRAAHEKPPGLSDLLEAKVEFRIAADGTLSSAKIVDSSGSAEFDRSVLEAVARVRSIGPTPNGKSDVWVVTFRMKEEE